MRGRRNRSRSANRTRSRKREPRRDSRSRSRRERNRSSTREDAGTRDVVRLKVQGPDVAFVLGRQGRTKRKLARVSGGQLNIKEADNILEISGSPTAKKKLQEYVGYVLAQRVGDIFLDFDQAHDNLQIVPVPVAGVGYVTGKQGAGLRALEEEWNTIMFFVKHQAGGQGDLMSKFLVSNGDSPRREGAGRKRSKGDNTEQDNDDNDDEEVGSKSGRKRSSSDDDDVGCDKRDNRRRGRDNDDSTISMDLEQDDQGEDEHPSRKTQSSVPSPRGSAGSFSSFKDLDNHEFLAIFGSKRSRVASSLRVLSRIDYKFPDKVVGEDGTFHKGYVVPGSMEFSDFGLETFPLSKDDYRYTLGHNGTTRKKIAKASGALLEYIGDIAFIGGTHDERRRCKDYLSFLLQQRVGNASVEDKDRSDMDLVEVKQQYVGFITGAKGMALRNIEMDTGTFCFTEGDRSNSTGKVLIFSHDRQARRRARMRIEDRVQEKSRLDRNRNGSGGDDRHRSNKRTRRRSSSRDTRSRPPPQRRRSRTPPRRRRDRSQTRRRR